MKKYLYTLVVALLFVLGACSPEEFGDPVIQWDPAANLVGTWQISKAIQVDENARFRGFPEEVTSKDITNALPGHPYTDFKITFNQNGTYAVDKGTSVVDLPDTQGNWSLNNPSQPSAINLVGANGAERQLDLIDLSGLQYSNAESRSLQLGLIRYQGNRAFVSYRYQMVYQQ